MPRLATPLTLGAPGIYHQAPAPLRALTGVRMDVCAFVGVSPRGPARVPAVGLFGDRIWADDVPTVEPDRPLRRSLPVAVESWDEYRRLYGSFEGRGLLPYAVASFFEQGGRRAYIVRIVHDYGAGHEQERPGVATAVLEGVQTVGGGTVVLRARDEGTWGNSLRATLSYTVSPLMITSAGGSELVLLPDDPLPGAALLRVTYANGLRTLRRVLTVEDRPETFGHGRERVATIRGALSRPPALVEVVEGVMELEDGDSRFPRRERHERLGLGFGHPRWAATVLCTDSDLVFPDAAWARDELIPPDDSLPPAAATAWSSGKDLSADVVSEDFFDDTWAPGDDRPGAGVHSLLGIEEAAMVVAPDLYSPRPLRPLENVADPVTLAGPEFDRCVHPPAAPPGQVDARDLVGLRLDPEIPADLEQIITIQQRLVQVAEQGSLVALLDVPPRLHLRQILTWRARFNSSYAAAYHPWLKVTRTEDLQAGPPRPGRRPRVATAPQFLVDVNPAAVAAGVTAQREWLFGVPFGPANELTPWIIDVAEAVSPAADDVLHQHAVNVYLKERDGVRLTAARTLSRDPAYRQLNVRRLMTMLARVLDREMQWVVFEPNNPALRADIEVLLDNYLRRLFTAGAFKGTTEAEAFFVRADDALNPTWVSDLGQLIVEVGVAPAEPLEFLVLQILRDGDGTLRVEGRSA